MKHFLPNILFLLLTHSFVFAQDYKVFLADHKRQFDKASTLEEKRKWILATTDSLRNISSYQTEKVVAFHKHFLYMLDVVKQNPPYASLRPVAYLMLAKNAHFPTNTHGLENYYNALEQARQYHDDYVVFQASYYIAGFLYDQKKYAEALQYFQVVDELFSTQKVVIQPKEFISMANLYCVMASMYLEQKNYVTSERFYDKAIRYAETVKDTTWLGLAHGNKSLLYIAINDHKKAKACLDMDIMCSLKMGNVQSAVHAYFAILKMAIQTKDYAQGNQALDNAWRLIPQMHDGDKIAKMESFYKQSYNFYVESKQFEKAIFYNEKRLELLFKSNQDKHDQELQKIQSKYNVKFKDQEITLLQKQKNAERWILYLVMLVALVVVALAVVLFRNNRKQLKINTLLNEKQEEIETQNEELNTQKEQLAYQNEALQQLNATKDKLFSIVSHDFRSPLNALKSTAYLMSREGISPTEVKELTTNVTAQINHTSYFLENLLFWAKSQLKGFHIEAERFDLQELVQENIELAYPQAEQKKIVLEARSHETVWIMADKNMTRLVLRNLLSNALKYSRQADRVTLAYQRRQDHVLITIQDTGLGMTTEQMQCIFTPHISSTYGTNQEKGAGLGLLLCKDFVERNGGEIWAESEAGKGSTFYFTLPLATADNTHFQTDGFVAKELENGGTLYRL